MRRTDGRNSRRRAISIREDRARAMIDRERLSVRDDLYVPQNLLNPENFALKRPLLTLAKKSEIFQIFDDNGLSKQMMKSLACSLFTSSNYRSFSQRGFDKQTIIGGLKKVEQILPTQLQLSLGEFSIIQARPENSCGQKFNENYIVGIFAHDSSRRIVEEKKCIFEAIGIPADIRSGSIPHISFFGTDNLALAEKITSALNDNRAVPSAITLGPPEIVASQNYAWARS